jgi:hypothetical protein
MQVSRPFSSNPRQFNKIEYLTLLKFNSSHNRYVLRCGKNPYFTRTVRTKYFTKCIITKIKREVTFTAPATLRQLSSVLRI